MSTSLAQNSSVLRIFTACLLTFMTLLGPIAPVGAATISATTPSNPGSIKPNFKEEPNPLSPAVPNITATKTDSFPDPNIDGKADPGETITYDVNISNSGGADATGVNFLDTIDANTTLVGGSLKVSPLAFADSYSTAQNTQLVIGTPGVLTNDSGVPAPTAVPIAGGATTQGGTVTLNADGSFTYNPAAAFTGVDTFTYTATNGLTPNDSAQVTINVDAAPSVVSTTPANASLDVLQNSTITINFSETVNVAAAGVTIDCGGGALGFSPALPQNNLLALVLTPSALLPAGSTCTVTVDKTKITDTDTSDPPDNMANDFVFSFKVKPDAVDDTYPVTLVGNVSTNSFVIPFSSAGNDVSATPVTITAVQANNTVVSNTITTTSANGGNIVMTVSGADMGKFTYDPPAGFEGGDSFTYTITRTDGGGSDTATVSIPISGMVWFVNNSAAPCTVVGCGRLSNPFSTLAAFNALNNGSGNNPAANDNIFIFTGAGNYTGPLSLLNLQRVIGQGATPSVSAITGLTPPAGSPSFPSTGGSKPAITTIITSGQNGINLASGNQLFGLAFSNTDGAAIRSSANIGTATMSDIVINNTGGGGIILTNGGSITISGINTIVTTTGTALNVSNTTIGAAGLNFQSISSNGGSGAGIILDTTGATGGLTVNGDGSNSSVGGNSSGGTIGNKSGGDGAVNGNGIYLNSTSNVVLRRMTINGTNQNFGIRGTNVNNFTLEFSKVTGTNGDNIALDEGSINFDNLTGSAAITACLIDGGLEDNLNVVNTSGTLNRLTVSGSTFGFNSTANGNNNILIESQNPATTLNFTLQSSLIKGSRADWLSVNNNSGSTGDTVIDGNTFDNLGANAHPGAAAGGNRIVFGGVGNSTVDIKNNVTKGSKGEAIRVRSTAVGAVTGTVNARVRNNMIGEAGTANSGSSESFGIFAFGDGGSDMTIAITNNQVFQYNNHGINLQFGDEINNGSAFNVTVTGNTVSNPGNLSTNFNGIQLNNGTVLATDDFISCVDIGGAGGLANSVAASGSGAVSPNNVDIRLRQRQATTVKLPGYAGANNDNAAVQAYLAARNTLATSNASNTVPTGPGFIGGAACTAPSFALFKPELTNQQDYVARASQTTKPVEITFAPTPESGADSNAASNVDEQTLVNSKPVSQLVFNHARIAKRSIVSSAPVSNVGTAHSTVRTTRVNTNVNRQQLNAVQDKKTRRGIRVKPEVALPGGDTVNQSIGTLLAGKSVHIQFQVTVNTPYLGGANVSNQGTISGSNFPSVQTDDPAAGGSTDPTLTPILLSPSVSVADAQANEPSTGSAPMLFTISLAAPAGASGASVHYATADQTLGAGHAVAGVDYTAVPDTVLNFAAGEQFKTVSVNVLADAIAGEPDETFLLNLSSPTNTVIGDGLAVGTIKQGNAAGTLLISELRTSGPGGAEDEFVEVYNNTDAPLTIAASDASGGYGLFKMGATCGATPVLIGTIPNGTVIPARGHYLFVGSAYSLAAYAAGDQTLSSDIESDRNVGIFNTSAVANLSSVTRLDAVGFGNVGGNCDLLREGQGLTPLSGSGLDYTYVRDGCGKKGNPAIMGACPTIAVIDTNNNSDDFIFADTSAANTAAGQRLGAPGPQNLGSPLTRTSTFGVALLDSNFPATSPPNRARDLTSVTNGANGTLVLRRRFVNNTGAPVTQLRLRVIDISSLAVPPGIADIRTLSSSNVVISGITDAATCLAANGVATTPCSVNVIGTTLEQPPNQSLGGGLNSTVGVGTVTLATPLAPGASINLQVVLGVQQSGAFKFFVNVEALP